MSEVRQVPFFDYQALFRDQEQEILTTMTDVMRRGAYILQRDLSDFEAALARYLGVRHVIGVADGTNAIMLALRAAGIGPGDEVIVPGHTYVATVAAVHYLGATPVLVECGSDHLVAADSARAALTARTRAILPVHLNGRTAEMSPIEGLADEHGLKIIEDAAQALGSKFAGRNAGTFGTAGTFSFYPSKLLGCFGDGGAVVTNDDETARRLRLLRDHGRDDRGEVIAWGTNCRLDNLQAAVLHLKLKTLDRDLERRREVARLYENGLAGVEQIVLPPSPDGDHEHFDVFQNYEIEAEGRDELQAHLEQRGVRTIVQFGGKAVHQFPGLGFTGVSLPVTERLYERMLLLPMNTSLTDADAEYVVSQVREFYGHVSA